MLWRAIMHDEEVYPDPFTFDPSRHLGDDPQPDPLKYVFGFGRRVCPGMLLWMLLHQRRTVAHLGLRRTPCGNVFGLEHHQHFGCFWYNKGCRWKRSGNRAWNRLVNWCHVVRLFSKSSHISLTSARRHLKAFKYQLKPRSAEHLLLLEGHDWRVLISLKWDRLGRYR